MTITETMATPRMPEGANSHDAGPARASKGSCSRNFWCLRLEFQSTGVDSAKHTHAGRHRNSSANTHADSIQARPYNRLTTAADSNASTTDMGVTNTRVQ